MYQVEIDGEIFAIELDDIEFANDIVRVNGEPMRVEIEHSDDGSGHLLINNRSIAFFLNPVEGREIRVEIDGREYVADVKSRKDLLLERFGGAGGAAAGHSDVKAPMPGLVLRVSVAVGDRVQRGQPLLVLEAMKMENEISSPGDGTIEAIHVTAGKAVVKSELLVEIGPVEGA